MTCAQLQQDWQKLKEVSREIKERKPKGENTMKEKKLKVTLPVQVIMNSKDRSFSHHVTAAILLFQTNHVGIGLFSYGKSFLCSHKFGTFDSSLSRNGALVGGRVVWRAKMHDDIMLMASLAVVCGLLLGNFGCQTDRIIYEQSEIALRLRPSRDPPCATKL